MFAIANKFINSGCLLSDVFVSLKAAHEPGTLNGASQQKVYSISAAGYQTIELINGGKLGVGVSLRLLVLLPVLKVWPNNKQIRL
jgi:hypothetical protein